MACAVFSDGIATIQRLSNEADDIRVPSAVYMFRRCDVNLMVGGFNNVGGF